MQKAATVINNYPSFRPSAQQTTLFIRNAGVFMDSHNQKIIRLRPHHGLCIQNFIGKGYSERFIDNMQQVIKQLQETNTKIILSVNCDVICEHCPHNQNGICESGQKVESFDKKCLSLCKLKEGQIISWNDYKSITYENILSCGKLAFVCTNCEWLDICNLRS